MTTTEMSPADAVAPDSTDEAALLAWLAEMRRDHPVWRDCYGMYHVFRHADVLTVLRDPTRFSSETSRLAPSAKPVSRGMLTQIDPPEHRRLRSIVSTAFTPGASPTSSRASARLPAGCSTPFPTPGRSTWSTPSPSRCRSP